jgi:NADH-quinone oxidoreductase subunit J
MMPNLIAALPTAQEILRCPTFWALAAGTIGLWLLLPTRFRFGNVLGSILIAIAGGLFAYDLPRLGTWTDQGVFWLLAGVTLGAAVCAIASQSPVYSAIWFALSILGTAGIFMFQGAQFLGVATVVVYAGAIVVTFLFVIMLAQPEGHSSYDRITWGGLPKVLAVVTAGALVGILAFMTEKLKEQAVVQSVAIAESDASRSDIGRLTPAARQEDGPRQADGGVLDAKHVANVGRHLFAEHLVSIELAGTLLLVALVGAVAIAIQGRPRLAERIEEALR